MINPLIFKKININDIQKIEFHDSSFEDELIIMESWEIESIYYHKKLKIYCIENCDGLSFEAKEIKITKKEVYLSE